IGLKKRQDPIVQGQPCSGVGDDAFCATGICRIKGEDTGKCQISDEREIGDPCPSTAACKAGLECGQEGFCQSKAASTIKTPTWTPTWTKETPTQTPTSTNTSKP
ncbi:20166_t:CDS:1, partial [Gigaspora rosea]